MANIPQIHSINAPDKAVTAVNKQSRFPTLNIPFLTVSLLLVCLGLVVVWSAVYSNDDYSFTRQLSGVAIGLVFMILIFKLDYRRLSDFTTLLIIVNVILILSPHLPLIGVEVKGAQSWVNLFGFQFQPGELAKLTVILLASSVVSRYGGSLDDSREYLKALGIMLIPFLCVMTQPDLGTGLVYIFVAAIALVAGGARLKFLIASLIVAIALFLLLLGIDELLKGMSGEYKLLKDYQRSRLMVFVDQTYAQTDEGYNLAQAKIAIGSGGFFGKGLLQATQSTMGFLPEAPTDFIFCVLAEEFGFLGVMVLLGLYLALIMIGLGIARSAGNLFGSVIVMCILGMWLFQILENIGMTVGLMPITGIPLPFVSFGSSFMIVNFMLLGLICSVWAHRGR